MVPSHLPVTADESEAFLNLVVEIIIRIYPGGPMAWRPGSAVRLIEDGTSKSWLPELRLVMSATAFWVGWFLTRRRRAVDAFRDTGSCNGSRLLL